MRVGVVRTIGRIAIRANTSPVKPWFNVTALPDTAANMFGVALSGAISAFRE
jgi:hypothetical protein